MPRKKADGWLSGNSLHGQAGFSPALPLNLDHVDEQKAIPLGGDRHIRIVHLATRLIFAGMGQVVASLVRDLPSRRYRSAIWCIEEADSLGQKLQSEGYKVIALGRNRRRDFGLFFRIATLVRREQIDILHCHDDLSWFYGTIGARLGRISRILVTMHGRRPEFSRRHLWEQRALAGLTKSVVCVSSYLRQQIITEIGASPNKVVVVRNGIPLRLGQLRREQRQRARDIFGVPDSAIVVGSVGRLAEVKNLDLLIAAVADARAAVPVLRLVLVGEGPCQEHLIRKVTALGLSEVVIFTGLRNDVPELLPGFDLYVCSSDYEGVSLSILEAMAAARAVIATAVGGNPEIVHHNKTGILVERRNHRALAQALVELSRDAARRLQLGQQAKDAVEKIYGSDRMIDDYDALYQAILHPSLRVPTATQETTDNLLQD